MELTQLVRDFEDIVGWPYVSPGTNDEKGIDCSGAFVRAFKRQGKDLYHGSNRMARSACAWVKKAGDTPLGRGMVVFKARDSEPPAAYRPGGAWYDPALPQDFYHVGLVVSAFPPRIIHATMPKAKVDAGITGWTHAGWLKTIKEEEHVTRTVTASTLNLRKGPSSASARLAVIPGGTALDVGETADGWCTASFGGKTGYVMEKYLAEVGETAAGGETVALDAALARSLYAALGSALGEAVR